MSASSSRLVVGLLFVIGTAACTYLTPYKIDIQQGNVVTPEAIEKLKVGMTKSQVGFILGTPLLADVFHGNRWDYVYYLRKGGRVREERKVRLLFEDSNLKQIAGDVVVAKAKDAKPIEAATTAKDNASSEATTAKDAAPNGTAKANAAAPGDATTAKVAEPGGAATAKDASSGPSMAKDAELNRAATAQEAEPSEAAKTSDARPSEAAKAKDAASDAEKAIDTAPREPRVPVSNETKQP